MHDLIPCWVSVHDTWSRWSVFVIMFLSRSFSCSLFICHMFICHWIHILCLRIILGQRKMLLTYVQYISVFSHHFQLKKKSVPTFFVIITMLLWWRWWFSRIVVSDSLWPHKLQPTRLLCPWNFPEENTGVGCHFLLQGIFLTILNTLPLKIDRLGSLHQSKRKVLLYLCFLFFFHLGFRVSPSSSQFSQSPSIFYLSLRKTM